LKKACLSTGLFFNQNAKTLDLLRLCRRFAQIAEDLIHHTERVARCRGFLIKMKDVATGGFIGDIQSGDNSPVIMGKGDNGPRDGDFLTAGRFLHDLRDIIDFSAVKGTGNRWPAKKGLDLDQSAFARFNARKLGRIELISMAGHHAAAGGQAQGKKSSQHKSFLEKCFWIKSVHGINILSCIYILNAVKLPRGQCCLAKNYIQMIARLSKIVEKWARPAGDQAHLLYLEITQAARMPEFYIRYGVDDTLDGRFDTLTLLVVLTVRRLQKAGQKGRNLAQEVIDMMFADMDLSLHEIGVSENKVGKKVKTMATAFLGRMNTYSAALDAGDKAALAAALARNLYRDNGTDPQENGLVAAVFAEADRLDALEDSILLADAPSLDFGFVAGDDISDAGEV